MARQAIKDDHATIKPLPCEILNDIDCSQKAHGLSYFFFKLKKSEDDMLVKSLERKEKNKNKSTTSS